MNERQDTAFAALLGRVRAGADGCATVELPAGWGQGRSVFGGLVVALALRALRAGVPVERRPRSLLASFVGPVDAGPVEVEAETLRSGRAVSHVAGRVLQGGTVRCSLLAAFGAGRDSRLAVAAPARPAAPGPEGLEELPYVEGMTPEFTRHVAYRWASGGHPFSGAETTATSGWCRLRDPAAEPAQDNAAEEHALALLDAWPAPLLQRLTRPAPASSLTWAVDFVDLGAEPAAGGWWFFRSATTAAGEGYAHSDAELWDPSGRLAVLGRQAVTIFA